MNEQRGPLSAQLSLSSKARAAEDVAAVVDLRNEGDAPLRLDLWPLRSPSLTLEVRDAADQPVRLPPPPVPGGGSEPLVLGSGESTRLDYGRFLPAWIEPGRYRVRFRFTQTPLPTETHIWGGRIESAWETVEIG